VASSLIVKERFSSKLKVYKEKNKDHCWCQINRVGLRGYLEVLKVVVSSSSHQEEDKKDEKEKKDNTTQSTTNDWSELSQGRNLDASFIGSFWTGEAIFALLTIIPYGVSAALLTNSTGAHFRKTIALAGY